MILKYIIAWIPMIFIGIANGILRQAGYARFMSELRAHQLSTLTGIIFFGLYIWALNRWWRVPSAEQALAIGFIWLGMTIIFEFIFGHYVMGHPWSRLFHDYNLLKGRVWILVLIWITIAPYLFYRISGQE